MAEVMASSWSSVRPMKRLLRANTLRGCSCCFRDIISLDEAPTSSETDCSLGAAPTAALGGTASSGVLRFAEGTRLSAGWVPASAARRAAVLGDNAPPEAPAAAAAVRSASV